MNESTLTGKAAWLFVSNVSKAFLSPSPVIWLADMSKILSLGIVAAADISSGRRSLFRRLAEMRSSVRLACSLSARRRGVRAAGGKLSPQTFTQELLSCTSHSRDTRRFSSNTHIWNKHILWSISQNSLWRERYLIQDRVTHPLSDSDRLSCSAQGEEEDPMNTPQQQPATGRLTKRWKKKGLPLKTTSTFSRFTTQRHCLASEDLQYSTHFVWTTSRFFCFVFFILELDTLWFKAKKQPVLNC